VTSGRAAERDHRPHPFAAPRDVLLEPDIDEVVTMAGPMDQRKIVVGVDGSPLSEKALRWAVDFARWRKAEVEAVLAWQVPARVLIMPTSTDSDFEERHERILEKAVSEAVGDVTDVPVHRHLIEHRPAAALVSAARGAQLLVIAARGERVVPGVQLGSVARFCVDHAACPVLVFREEGPPRGGIGH
jgi:nucleotide-binding universal stress UspA family protein